jgi:type I restriction enzyme R subunit
VYPEKYTTDLQEGCYTEDDVQSKTDEVFPHVYRVYPTIPSPFYADIGV